MPSYIPEYRYGLIPGSYLDPSGPRYGLLPWPAHMMPNGGNRTDQHRANLHEVSKAATISLSEADGIFFLTLNSHDRLSIATTVERLIGMLDELDGDADFEPSIGSDLGGGSAHDERELDDCDDEPWLGWGENGPHASNNVVRREQATIYLNDDREHDTSDDEPWLASPERHPSSAAGGWGIERNSTGDQTNWAAGWRDDREDDHDGREPDHDAEHSLGWQAEGSQAYLWGTEDEPELGSTEEVDQVRRIEVEPSFVIDGEQDSDGEPTMGWPETCGQGPKIGIDASPDDITTDPDVNDCVGGPAMFDGSGEAIALRMIEAAQRMRSGDVMRSFEPAPGYEERRRALRARH